MSNKVADLKVKKPKIHYRTKPKRVVSSKEFADLCRQRKIYRSRFILPRLGEIHFGAFEIEENWHVR